MTKSYKSLGLMSGTSGDGVDASIIQSEGETKYISIYDGYFQYNKFIFEKIHDIKQRIKSSNDLNNLSSEIKSLEKKITIFHADVVNQIIKKTKEKINVVGFHGQTIFHNAKEKTSIQLGDGKLLAQLTKKNIVYNFRENDLRNGGQGAPLTPIFHGLIEKKLNIKPVTFFNIGGIINKTVISNEDNELFATDIGPGMCLIDQWIRNNSENRYDKDGSIAKSGKINKIILNQALDRFFENPEFYNNNLDNINHKHQIKSFDTKDFDISFVRGLSLEDGAATLTEFSLQTMLPSLDLASKNNSKIILCGGGRKNLFLINCIKRNKIKINLIDEFNIDGDFIESQAFAYLAIRTVIKKPISFPNTTGVKNPCLGGILVEAI
jgi:anhydro-N-acetylmuramic acid kinase